MYQYLSVTTGRRSTILAFFSSRTCSAHAHAGLKCSQLTYMDMYPTKTLRPNKHYVIFHEKAKPAHSIFRKGLFTRLLQKSETNLYKLWKLQKWSHIRTLGVFQNGLNSLHSWLVQLLTDSWQIGATTAPKFNLFQWAWIFCCLKHVLTTEYLLDLSCPVDHGSLNNTSNL